MGGLLGLGIYATPRSSSDRKLQLPLETVSSRMLRSHLFGSCMAPHTWSFKYGICPRLCDGIAYIGDCDPASGCVILAHPFTSDDNTGVVMGCCEQKINLDNG